MERLANEDGDNDDSDDGDATNALIISSSCLRQAELINNMNKGILVKME